MSSALKCDDIEIINGATYYQNKLIEWNQFLARPSANGGMVAALLANGISTCLILKPSDKVIFPSCSSPRR